MGKSLSVNRLKLMEMPFRKDDGKKYRAEREKNMLPKVKELEKIARTERKKQPKLNKYVDGVSDLQLYMANKTMKNFSTREIVGQLARDVAESTGGSKLIDNNYDRMTFSGV
jgi:hypothetical protein